MDGKLEMIGNLEAFWLLRLLLDDSGGSHCGVLLCVLLVCLSPVVGDPWSCVLSLCLVIFWSLSGSLIIWEIQILWGRFKMLRGTKNGSESGRLMLGIFEELGKADSVDDFEDQMAWDGDCI